MDATNRLQPTDYANDPVGWGWSRYQRSIMMEDHDAVHEIQPYRGNPLPCNLIDERAGN
jgi:hypothetical protein